MNKLLATTALLTLSLNGLGESVPPARYEKMLELVPAPSDAPTSTGVNQGFSRDPKPATWDPSTKTLTVEGLLPTLRHSKHGNNRRFVIVQWKLSEDNKTLTMVSRQIFEGASDLGFANVSALQEEAIAPGVFKAAHLIVFELDEQGNLLRCTQREFNKEGKCTHHLLLYPDARKGSKMIPMMDGIRH